jgi:hypothetical protein
MGSVSAVKTINSAMPRFRVLVAIVGAMSKRTAYEQAFQAHLHWHLFSTAYTAMLAEPNPESTHFKMVSNECTQKNCRNALG